MTFSVEVRGIPKAQGRARAFAFKRGDQTRVRMYAPETSRDWKRTVTAQVLERYGHEREPLAGPITLDLAFGLLRPKSLPKRVLHHVKKPDVDNLAKAVKDAMKGIVYRDDSQVVSLHVAKGYSATPGVRIQAMTVEEP